MTPAWTVEDTVDRVAEVLEVRIGLRTEPTVRARLRRCVLEEASAQGLDLRSYISLVTVDGTVFEGLLERITVQETSFFRHPEQFAALVDVILPAIGSPVRFWSAGCANGQEAYSLAMVLEEQRLAGQVVATDLSAAALRRTAAGRYTGRELTGLSPARIARFLARSDRDWEVTRALRDRVVIMRHNLVEPPPEAVRSCQVVFCRNVLIYIAPEHARTFLERVADMVAPTALFLGSAEAIWPVTDRFEAVRIGNTFVHRPRPPATAERARSAPVAKDSGAGPPAAGTTAARRGAGHRHPVGRKRKDRAPASPPAPVSVVSPVSPVVDADADVTTQLASTGQQALTTGDSRSAVVSFRKWAYLAPADALAQLHLGLALEADGDLPAARRAYAVARRLLLAADPAHVERATEGYATGELLRLLDHKEQGLKP